MRNVPIEELLAPYPRVRSPITELEKRIYEEELKLNRIGKGWLFEAVQFLESWMPRKVARLKGQKHILEIGSGSLNHVPYETDAEAYDCIEPFSALFATSAYMQKIKNFYTIRTLTRSPTMPAIKE